MSNEPLKCLLSHKCSEQVHSLGVRLAKALSRHNIALLIDPFRYGEDFSVRMKSVDFDALLFLITTASLKSNACQVELKTARRKGVPIFTALLEGEIPRALNRRLSWKLEVLDKKGFAEQVHALADAMRTRASVRKEILLLTETNPPDITQRAAQNLANAEDRTVVAEFARELAKRYRQLTDPTSCFFIALALGNACTPEAARLLRALPPKEHPLPFEGIQQALEMIAHGC